jgi:hypothetical protein
MGLRGIQGADRGNGGGGKEGKAPATSAAQAISPRTSPPKQKRLPSPSWGGLTVGERSLTSDAHAAGTKAP